jgi:hypothetical protein
MKKISMQDMYAKSWRTYLKRTSRNQGKSKGERTERTERTDKNEVDKQA